MKIITDDIQAVLFDLGDTLHKLVKFDFESGQDALCSFLKIEKQSDRFRKLQKELEILFTERDNSVFEIDFKKHLKLSLNLLNVFPNESYATIDGVKEYLEQLKSKGVRLGVISNSCFSAKLAIKELKKAGIAEYFETVILSCDYGIRKPSEYLYKLALVNLGAEPENSLYIGNKISTDMTGAEKAGMKSLLYDPGNEKNYKNVFSSYAGLISE